MNVAPALSKEDEDVERERRRVESGENILDGIHQSVCNFKM